MKNDIGSNWAERDYHVPNYTLKIANSRGKKLLMKDIKKAYDLINGIIQELNPNEAKNILKDIDLKLWSILSEKTNQ